VCTPACKEGQKWDYPQVKAIAGQGKLYVRLLKLQATMGQEEPSTLDDHPSSIHVPEYEPLSLNECTVGAHIQLRRSRAGEQTDLLYFSRNQPACSRGIALVKPICIN